MRRKECLPRQPIKIEDFLWWNESIFLIFIFFCLLKRWIMKCCNNSFFFSFFLVDWVLDCFGNLWVHWSSIISSRTCSISVWFFILEMFSSSDKYRVIKYLFNSKCSLNPAHKAPIYWFSILVTVGWKM